MAQPPPGRPAGCGRRKRFQLRVPSSTCTSYTTAHSFSPACLNTFTAVLSERRCAKVCLPRRSSPLRRSKPQRSGEPCYMGRRHYIALTRHVTWQRRRSRLGGSGEGVGRNSACRRRVGFGGRGEQRRRSGCERKRSLGVGVHSTMTGGQGLQADTEGGAGKSPQGMSGNGVGRRTSACPSTGMHLASQAAIAAAAATAAGSAGGSAGVQARRSCLGRLRRPASWPPAATSAQKRLRAGAPPPAPR